MYSAPKPKVTIILSTFNGEAFLEQQLESLFNQTYPNIDLFIRDDGSSDGTISILKRYEDNFKINICYGKNIGVIRSFFRLINSIPGGTSYVALCDQDDVWDKDKIARAIRALSEYNEHYPAMYCSAVRWVDEELRYIGCSKEKKHKAKFENALVHNIANGCTIMINQAAHYLIADKNIDFRNIRMHDWWIYLVISAFGKVFYDAIPTMNYRQHGNNVVGASSGINLWKKRIKRHFKKNKRSVINQVKEFLIVYGSELPSEKYITAKNFLLKAGSRKLGERVFYALQAPVYRQNYIDDILMRVLISIGRI